MASNRQTPAGWVGDHPILNILIRLFSPHGFAEPPTTEPNICLRPENLFMARIGGEVPEKLRQDFKWLRFGITP